MTPPKNGNGNRVIITSVSVAATLMTVIISLVLQSKIEPLVEKVNTVTQRLDKHEALESHIGTAERLAEIKIMFTESERQIENIKDIVELNDRFYIYRVEQLEGKQSDSKTMHDVYKPNLPVRTP